MSQQALPLVIGVAFAVGVVATGGALGVATPILVLAAGAAVAIGTYAGSQIFVAGSPHSSNSQAAATASYVRLSTSTEGPPVPVIFGAQQVVGNYLQFDPALFFIQPVAQFAATPGAKGFGGGRPGSSSAITSYLYYASWELGLCMGPIDGVRNVWASPGNDLLRFGYGTFAGYSDDTPLLLEFIGVNGVVGPTGEGGAVNLYRGSATQSRVAGDPYLNATSTRAAGVNYRNVCFAVFNGYCLGSQNLARSCMFELLRYPKPVYNPSNDGVTLIPVPEMETKGSNDSMNESYWDANPAAAMYEILTDKVWGMGFDYNDIDIDSFVSASKFFTAQNLGMSFSFTGNTTLQEIADTMKSHVGLVMYFDGQKYTCKVMHQIDDSTYADIPILDENHINGLTATRNMASSGFNEVRAEYVDRVNQYTVGLSMAQSMASLFPGQSPNPTRINLRGFSHGATVQSQLARIQREGDYPFWVIEFYMHRNFSALRPLDLFQLNWPEWSGIPITGYFRMTTMSDDEQSEQGIKCTAIEDFYLSPTQAPASSPPTPTPSYQNTPTTPDSEINTAPPSDLVFPVLTNLLLLEANCYIGRGQTSLIAMADKAEVWLFGCDVQWSPDGMSAYTSLGVSNFFAITGALLTTLPAAPYNIDRTKSFDFSLLNVADEADILSAGTLVLSGSDSMQNIGTANVMIIGKELIQIGKITKISSNHYRAENYIRAQGGTVQASHAIADKFFFQASPSAPINASSVSPLIDLIFDVHLASGSAVDPTDNTYYLPANFGAAKQINQLGVRPFPPSLISKTGSGPYSFVIRPRLISHGAGVLTDFVSDLYQVNTAMEDLAIIWQGFNGGSSTGAQTSASFTWTPEDGITVTTGTAAFTASPAGGSDRVRIWTSRAGKLSIDYLEVIL